MIRLSEAMARLSCKDEVIPKHVKEAFRLLNKSIIRVESPDIDFDDEEEPQQDLENGVSVRFSWLYNKFSLYCTSLYRVCTYEPWPQTYTWALCLPPKQKFALHVIMVVCVYIYVIHR